jgi:hypothetical protein
VKCLNIGVKAEIWSSSLLILYLYDPGMRQLTKTKLVCVFMKKDLNIKLKIYLTAILMIAVCGCGERASKKDNIGEVIRINPHEATDYVNLSEIADSIKCIRLQPDSSDVMGRVVNVIIRKKYIYALDVSQQMVFVFDKTGKFVTKLSKKGQGPGEYVWLGNIFVDDNEEYIEVLDMGTDTKIKYTNISFELVESLRGPTVFSHNNNCRKNGGFYYFEAYLLDNIINDKHIQGGVVIIDDKNNMKIVFEKKTETNGIYFYPTTESFAQNDRNELFISMPYDNTFYRLEAGEAYPVYTVDFGKYGIANNNVGKLSTRDQLEYMRNMKGLACFPVLNINNSDIMSFSYFFKQKEVEREKNHIFSYEKDIRQYIKIKDKVYHTNRIKNDLTSFPDRLYICSYIYGNYLHEVWHEDYLVDVIATHNYFADSDIDKIYVEGLGEVTSDEEIIVVLMKLKK